MFRSRPNRKAMDFPLPCWIVVDSMPLSGSYSMCHQNLEAVVLCCSRNSRNCNSLMILGQNVQSMPTPCTTCVFTFSPLKVVISCDITGFLRIKKMHLWNWTWRKKTQVTKISHKVIFHHLPNYLFSRLYGVPMGSMWVFRVLLGNPWKPPDTAAFSPPVVLETPNFPPACGTKIWIWATEIRVVTTKTGGLTNKNDRKRGFNQQKLRFATNKTGDAHQQKLQKEWEYPK